jgi:hypothetical protein
MTIPITYSIAAQAVPGPTFSETETINVEAIDVLEVPVPASSGTVVADVQPKFPFDMQMLFLKSDNYADLYYASHIEYPATAGYHVSAAYPSTDIGGQGAGAKLKIKADADTSFHEITIDATGLNTGGAIAAAIESAIQALGGIYAAVTFVYTTIYTCTSGTTGATSKIRINPGTANDLCQPLKIGTAPV